MARRWLILAGYRLIKEVKDGTSDFANRFPKATLFLLDALIAEDRSQMPYKLGKMLTLIAETQPLLRLTMQWLRFDELAN